MTDSSQPNITLMDGRRMSALAVHCLFIGIIFILPEALLRVAVQQRTIDITWPMYAKSTVAVAAFYINFFIVIPRTLFAKKNILAFLAWNLLIILSGAFLIWFIYRYLYQGPRTYNITTIASLSYFLRDSIMLLMAVSLAVAIRLSHRWLLFETKNQHLMALRRQNELAHLRAQLNPHFLFNSLNTIYALISIDPDSARMAVHRISALLRYLIYESPSDVPLAAEVKFITNYVELMRLRMPERPIRLNVEIPDTAVFIHPMLFLTLVENAFKHGNTADQSLPIDISIKADSDRIVCTTSNFFDRPSIHHSEQIPSANASAGGFGLQNLKRLIKLIYDSAASLSVNSDGPRYIATLSIPITKDSSDKSRTPTQYSAS